MDSSTSHENYNLEHRVIPKFGIIYKISIVFEDITYIYIGQTTRNMDVRFNEHINNNEIIRSFINDENCIDYSCEEISSVQCREGLNYEDLSLLLNYRETLWIKRYNSCNTDHGLNRKNGPSNRGKGNEFDLAIKKYKREKNLDKKRNRVWYKYNIIKKGNISVPRRTHCNFKRTKR
jgi:hypothetical protein